MTRFEPRPGRPLIMRLLLLVAVSALAVAERERRWIVSLESGHDAFTASALPGDFQLVSSLTASLPHHQLHAVVVRQLATASAAVGGGVSVLANLPGVAHVEEDVVVALWPDENPSLQSSPSPTPTPASSLSPTLSPTRPPPVNTGREQSCPALGSSCTWGIDRVDQRANPLNRKYRYHRTGGEGTDVYVLDSGVNVRHQEFEGRAMVGGCFPFDAEDSRWCETDCNGHGTHVAGTIGSRSYGIAKNATMIGVKVMNCDGIGAVSDIVSGIRWSVDRHVQLARNFSVVNLSLGGVRSVAIDRIVEEAVKSGVVVVAAAGNEHLDACSTSPARSHYAITVGSIDEGRLQQKDKMSYFSNYGSCVDLLAPGADIRSLSYYPFEDDAEPEGTVVLRGTSMSAPMVSGAVLQFISRGRWEGFYFSSVAEIKEHVLQKATSGQATSTTGSTPNLILFTDPSGDFPEQDGPPVLYIVTIAAFSVLGAVLLYLIISCAWKQCKSRRPPPDLSSSLLQQDALAYTQAVREEQQHHPVPLQ